MDTLPSSLIGSRHGQRLSFVLFRIADIVQRESSHHNQRNQSRQEHDDHERIENAEPVDLRLEKVEFQVAIKPIPELHGRRNKLDRGGQHHGTTRHTSPRSASLPVGLHHHRVGRCHVHLHNAVVVVADNKGAMSVHSTLVRNHFMLTLAITYPVHNYSFLLHFLNFFVRHVQISHLRPNWKTINFELLLKISHKDTPGTSNG